MGSHDAFPIPFPCFIYGLTAPSQVFMIYSLLQWRVPISKDVQNHVQCIVHNIVMSCMWYGECVCCGASMYEIAGILLARKYWWLSSFVAIKHEKNSYSSIGTEVKVSALSPLLISINVAHCLRKLGGAWRTS